MGRHIEDKDLEDGKKISDIFKNLSENGKLMASVYLSALLDKEATEDSEKKAG